MSAALLLLLSMAGAPSSRAVSPDRAGHCEQPRWSRDGQHLAYRRWHERSVELDVLWELKREARVLPEAPGGAKTGDAWAALGTAPSSEPACRHFAWGPSAEPESFAFACSRGAGGYGLYVAPGRPIELKDDVATPHFAVGADSMVFIAGGQVHQLSCRRLGRSCSFARAEPAPLTRDPAVEWAGPKLAKDGWVVVERHEGARTGDLFVLAAQSLPRRLSRTPGPDRAVSIAPQGDRVAWFSRPPKAKGRAHELWMSDLSPDAEPVRLAERVLLAEEGPGWLPDGEGLLFVLDSTRKADPVFRVAVPREGKPGVPEPLKLGTVANRGPVAAAGPKGEVRIAVSALGRKAAKDPRAWRRIYVSTLP